MFYNFIINIMDKLSELYDEMLNLHIGTKTNDTVFHAASAAFYETLFDALHDSKEAMQDSKQAKPVDAKMARKRAYEILEEAKLIVEGMVNSNKDMAADNVLRGLVDKLWFSCGNARALCPCNKDATEEPAEDEATETTEDEVKEDEMEDEAESPEETEDEYEEDIVDESMKGQESGYTFKSKEEKPEEDDMKKKMKGSSEYTVVSIMPE